MVSSDLLNYGHRSMMWIKSPPRSFERDLGFCKFCDLDFGVLDAIDFRARFRVKDRQEGNAAPRAVGIYTYIRGGSTLVLFTFVYRPRYPSPYLM